VKSSPLGSILGHFHGPPGVLIDLRPSDRWHRVIILLPVQSKRLHVLHTHAYLQCSKILCRVVPILLRPFTTARCNTMAQGAEMNRGPWQVFAGRCGVLRWAGTIIGCQSMGCQRNRRGLRTS
jgi:hypothetical protein